MVKSICLAVLLTTAAVTLWIFGFVMVVGILEEVIGPPQRSSESHHFVFRDDGLPVWRKADYRKGAEFAEYHDLDGQPVEMTLKNEHSQMVTLIDSRLWRQPKRAIWTSRIVPVGYQPPAQPNVGGTATWFFKDDGERGYFVSLVGVKRQVNGYVGQKGFSRKLPPRSDWFVTRSGNEWHNLVSHLNPWDNRAGWIGLPFTQQVVAKFPETANYGQLFVEPDGRRVFAIDLKQNKLVVIHEGEPVFSASFVSPAKAEEPLKAVLRLLDSLRVVSLTKAGAGKVAIIPIPEVLRRAGALQWLKTNEGHTFVTFREEGWRLTMLNEALQPIGTRDVDDRRNEIHKPPPFLLLAAFVGVQSPALADLFASAILHEGTPHQDIDTSRLRELGLEWPTAAEMSLSELIAPLGVLQLTAIVWMVLTVRRLRRFSASSRDQWLWGVWTLLFGAPGYLAFRAHREWRLIPVSSVAHLEAVPRPLGSGQHQVCKTGTLARRMERDGQECPSYDEAESATNRSRRLIASLPSAYGRLLDLAELRGANIAARVGLSPSHTALALKEFRLTAGLALLASLVYVVVLARLIGIKGLGIIGDWVSPTSAAPFVHDGFTQPFMVVGILLAVWLAVWQSVAESRSEAWLFMLQRPVSRRAIVLSKLSTGLLLVTGCTAWPILVYATWASRPGSVAAPFEWGMTEIAWRQWAALTPIYLGTLLAMLRPARWIGTRLLPVIAVIGWLPGREALGIWCWPVWWELLAVLVIDVCLVSVLFLVVREREYP